MNKISEFLSNVKKDIKVAINWLKTNGEYKVIGISFLVGLLTFSTWASLFLAILVYGGYTFVNQKIPSSYASIINIDFNKYVINIVIGLVCGSIINYII